MFQSSRLPCLPALLVALLLLLLLLSTTPLAVVEAAEPAICTAPVEPVVLRNPTVVSPCTEAALQAALDKGGAISFACGGDPATIKLTKALKTNGKDTVLDGGGLVTLDGQEQVRILEKPFSGDSAGKPVSNTLTIQNLRLVNGRAPNVSDVGGSSGGALNAGSPKTRVQIINAVFENNRTTNTALEDNQGGAVFVNNAYETIIVGSLFRNNQASSGGAFGGIATGLLVYNSRFENNQAPDATAGGIVRGHGGALYLDGTWNDYNPVTNDQLTICGSSFTGNSAVRAGGAMASILSDNHRTKVTISRALFRNNRVLGRPGTNAEYGTGGAIYHYEDDRTGGASEDNFELSRSAFVGNSALKQGGGLWIGLLGRGVLSNTTWVSNTTTAPLGQVGQGGAVAIVDGTYEIASSTFAFNRANFQGGALFGGGESTPVTLRNTIFYSNTLNIQAEPFGGSQYQGFHTNRPLTDGGKNIQFPRLKPTYNNDINNNITASPLFVDPLLAPLADNGGRTETLALRGGSPAINAAASGCPTTDQRGAARVGTCDIGAFEFGATPPAAGLPLLTRIEPAIIAVGPPEDLVLRVYGSGFTASSSIRWNGTDRPTTFVSSGELQATIPKGELASIGTRAVTVFDGSIEPDGAETAALTLRVAEQIRSLAIPFVAR